MPFPLRFGSLHPAKRGDIPSGLTTHMKKPWTCDRCDKRFVFGAQDIAIHRAQCCVAPVFEDHSKPVEADSTSITPPFHHQTLKSTQYPLTSTPSPESGLLSAKLAVVLDPPDAPVFISRRSLKRDHSDSETTSVAYTPFPTSFQAQSIDFTPTTARPGVHKRGRYFCDVCDANLLFTPGQWLSHKVHHARFKEHTPKQSKNENA